MSLEGAKIHSRSQGKRGKNEKAGLHVALQAVSAQRIARRIDQLARIGGLPNGGVTRLGLTEHEQVSRRLVGEWLSRLGYSCRIDDACNLWGYQGTPPRLLLGSHLDTVPEGGRYDGALGVVAAVEVAEALRAAGLKPPIEVVAWSAEEGARYRPGHFGSAAATGQLPDDAWDHPLQDGVRVRDAVATLLGRVPDVETARRDARDFLAYLELHIEQGPILADRGLPLGVVTSIVGMTRAHVRVVGRADHPGTTPMSARRDALAASAECVLTAERLALTTDSLVATVGELSVEPGATNVVPGACRFSLEVRSPSDALRRAAATKLWDACAEICRRRAVEWSIEAVHETPAVALSDELIEALESSCRELGFPPLRLASGAGHDAQNVRLCGAPTGMLFVRSTGGSHNPSEDASAEDTAGGARVLLLTATKLAWQGLQH